MSVCSRWAVISPTLALNWGIASAALLLPPPCLALTVRFAGRLGPLLVSVAVWRKALFLNMPLFSIERYVRRVASSALSFSIGLSLSCAHSVMSCLLHDHASPGVDGPRAIASWHANALRPSSATAHAR